MAQGKQAKIISFRQEASILRHLETTRYPERDRCIFLLSIKAGLRAKEIASITWAMVTDSEGEVTDSIALEDKASKGKGGRTIPMHADLHLALVTYRHFKRYFSAALSGAAPWSWQLGRHWGRLQTP